MSFLDSLKTAAQASHPEAHERINKAIKASLHKASVVTKTIAVETIGNALVVADPLTAQVGAIAQAWWSGISNAAEEYDRVQAMKQAAKHRSSDRH